MIKSTNIFGIGQRGLVERKLVSTVFRNWKKIFVHLWHKSYFNLIKSEVYGGWVLFSLANPENTLNEMKLPPAVKNIWFKLWQENNRI